MSEAGAGGEQRGSCAVPGFPLHLAPSTWECGVVNDENAIITKWKMRWDLQIA